MNAEQKTVRQSYSLIWGVINLCQVLCIFALSAVLITIALVERMIQRDAHAGLMIAHKYWGPGVLFFSGSRFKAEGLENILRDKPCIYLMNHQSALDIPFIFSALPVPLRFVVKKELKKIPFLGWYIQAMGMIFVDRSDREKAIASLQEAARLIRSGANILAYPEGTRTYDGSLLPFKKGPFVLALEAGVPIIPVAIEGSQHALPRNSYRLRPTKVRLKFGRPIQTTMYSVESKDLLMRKVREELVKLHQEIGGMGDQSTNSSTTVEALSA